jgi:hypothetical protein
VKTHFSTDNARPGRLVPWKQAAPPSTFEAAAGEITCSPQASPQIEGE